jgi:hypothetical protein
MNKYKIEGGIDFFDELYKSLNIEESEEKSEEDKCLITNNLLTDKHVSLLCGHKFNYTPLYNDLINHKKKFNYKEERSGKLNTNEIRCPYCRKKQQGVLPYYEEFGLEKVNGVNFYDPKYTFTNKFTNKCEYKFPNENYNPTKPESPTNSKYLNNQSCDHYHGTKISLYNSANPSKPITFADSKHYCYTHKKMMIKQYKTEQKKLEKQMKLLEKQNLKAKENEEKQKAKELAKALKKNPISENIVLGPSIINQIGCVQILKTGPNKGNLCACKIVSENMCKRHFLMNHKELVVNN